MAHTARVASVRISEHCVQPSGAEPARPALAARPLLAGLLLGLLLGAPTLATAQLPVGPRVAHGTAAIATAGKRMTVTNSAGAIINWQGFSIGANHGVHFAQPSAASQVLNRVTGRDPSHILGSLSSNGGVWLINPHGVLFGPNARVDVAGLVASTLDIANADFLAGRYRFAGAEGLAGAQVLNQGELRTTFGGRLWLLGGEVQNEGLVDAPGGGLVLAAGKSVELVDSGAPNVIVRLSAPENRVANLGTLSANGGRIDLHASIVNQDGLVQADRLGTDAAGQVVLQAATDLTLGATSETRAAGGRVRLGAETLNHRGTLRAKDLTLAATDLLQQGSLLAPGGTVTLAASRATYLDGPVDVSNPAGTAGRIQLSTGTLEGMAGGSLLANGLEGGQISIAGRGSVGFSSTLSATGTARGGLVEVTGNSLYLLNATVDASGGTQGGTVHLGGGWQGSGSLPHAREVLVGVGSEVKANSAGAAGTGGEVVVWSTEASEHYGALQALGGGRLEFSSQGVLRQTGTFEAGPGGTVLFDPKNLIITDNLPPLVRPIGVGDATFDANPDDTSYMTPGTITGLTEDGVAVTLQANNDIQVLSNLLAVGDGAGSLTLQAGRNIDFLASVQTPYGDLTAVAGDPAADPAHRDPGTPTLTIASGVTLNVQTGTAILAAIGGNVVNSAGDNAISTTGSGRWLIYAADPATSTGGFTSTSYNKHYNQGFTAGSTPDYAASGNWILYSLAPTLAVAPVSETIAYGDAAPTAFTPSYSGFIDGDNADSAGLSGAATWVIAGAPSSSGNSTAGAHDVSFSGGLTSSLGYLLADDAASTGELTVTPRDLSAVYVALGRVYDGTTAVALIEVPDGVLDGDSVFFSETAAFADKNVGTAKPVSVTGISLAGTDAGNYALLNTTAATTADITARGLTATYTGVDKVYDATTLATVLGSSADLIAGDLVSFSETAAFADKNVGTAKPVSVTGISLSGTDAGNYALLSTSAATTADITARGLTVAYTGVDRVYDATTLATVLGSSADLIAGDLVSFSETAAFADKNVGTAKPVSVTAITLVGLDAGNYALLNTSASTTADITPRPISASLIGDISRVYDSTTGAAVAPANVALSGLLAGDSVTPSVTGDAYFDTPDVGTSKPVTVPLVALTGADAGNYSLSAATVTASVGAITAAPLTYVAASATSVVGVPVTGLTGTVTGFLGSDSLSNATSGVLTWSTPATELSPPASYPIEGGGLSALNYAFVQAPGNATALTLLGGAPLTSPIEEAVQLLADSTETAVTLASLRGGGGGSVVDHTLSLEPVGAASFAPINLSVLSREQMEQFLESRNEFKKKLFADAIYKLEEDPSLADVPVCSSLAETQTGLCRMTDAQRREAGREAARHAGDSVYRVRLARLPQIQRKVAVLFGIDAYADSRIPSLDNAASDAEAVARLLGETLGYEVRVVTNASKADIVRALNQLSVDVGPSDSVVVYYAGHGDVIEKNGEGYWLPADASPDDPKQWISNADISRMLSGIPARQLAMISDSCYSGAFTREQKISVSESRLRPAEILNRRSVVVMSSGGDEPVADSGRGGHSIFAWYLMEGLRNVDNWQPGVSVFRQVQRQVSSAFPQTPQYGAAASAGHQAGGDYLFEFRQLDAAGGAG